VLQAKNNSLIPQDSDVDGTTLAMGEETDVGNKLHDGTTLAMGEETDVGNKLHDLPEEGPLAHAIHLWNEKMHIYIYIYIINGELQSD